MGPTHIYIPSSIVLKDFSVKNFLLNLTGLAATALALTVLTLCIYNRYFHPLAKFPGPFFASISPLYRLWMARGGFEHEREMELHRRYGTIIRVSPNTLVFNDPKLLPVVYHRRVDKTAFYNAGSMERGGWPSILNMKEWDKHATRRRQVAFPFNPTTVAKMRPLIQANVDKWIEKLREFADAGKPFNFTPWAQHLAFDVISELSFGEPIGFIRTGGDVFNLQKNLMESFKPNLYFMRNPTLCKWLNAFPLLGDLVLPTTKDPGGFGRVAKFRDMRIEERLNNPTDKPDVLGHILDGKDAEGNPIPMPQIKADLLIFLIAGSDTTAVTIRNTIIYLQQNRRCYEKLMATDLSAENQSAPDPKFPYLEACIKEAMRIKPAIPMFLPRMVSKGGIDYNGLHIPEGAEIGANIRNVHRDKAIFGEDADVYRPERYLESKEKTAELEKYNMAWGYGTRVCLGKSIAEAEILLGLKSMLTEFEPVLSDIDHPLDEENWGILVQKNMRLRLKHRS